MSGWLIDKSAYTRLARSLDPALWANRIERGLVRVTAATRLEMGWSARSVDDLRYEIANPPLARMPLVYLTPAIEDRAIEVQFLLAARGHHRAVSVPDLLIAAAAELSGLTVLHLDKDFDLVAATTGQPVERLELAAAP
ncbi:PIN domain nuclease [Mycobacterium talmoniae]|uniref:Ribonuclease VapC n=1 Tax=Mycobacterium talmoniae TaxID=1858794 RepID=A0A1S1NHC7_9MYCO|nr:MULTISPECIES: PIN domain nuclease [Mycobacterium]OHU99103.1 VapC toxin family PIN domain ribonuclease [Mycobacterium talmoniae]PQM46955.1 Ribonuclease VapC2 [Mycobacterium talmoniae]TDH48376.1 PIN domain nuclease [Mycobacterium eburneum]